MREHRRRPVRAVTTVVTTTAATVAAVALSSTAESAAAATPAQSATTSSSHVIVLLKNQYGALQTRRPGSASARSRAIASSQAPVINAARSAGARKVTAFHLINGFAATVTPSAAAALSRNPSVAAVVPDLPIRTAPIVKQDTASGRMRSAVSGPAPSTYCGTSANPILEPEALQTMKVDYGDPSKPSASDIADGTGVTVGYIADGVDIHNPDFMRNGSSVFTDYKDFSGDGLDAPSAAAESFGDASAIAAQGTQTYDVNTFSPSVNQPSGCYIKIRGVAPGANLVGLKVFGNSNSAPTSHFISAIQYAVNTDHVDVLNESFGGNPYPDTNDDPISLAEQRGHRGGHHGRRQHRRRRRDRHDRLARSVLGEVIAAAATTNFRSVEQVKLDGLTNPALRVTGWANDNISSLSSGGFAQNGKVPDVSAPGEARLGAVQPGHHHLRGVHERGRRHRRTSSLRRHQPGLATDRRCGGTGDPALQAGAPRGAAVAGAREVDLVGTAQDLDHPADSAGCG